MVCAKSVHGRVERHVISPAQKKRPNVQNIAGVFSDKLKLDLFNVNKITQIISAHPIHQRRTGTLTPTTQLLRHTQQRHARGAEIDRVLTKSIDVKDAGRR